MKMLSSYRSHLLRRSFYHREQSLRSRATVSLAANQSRGCRRCSTESESGCSGWRLVVSHRRHHVRYPWRRQFSPAFACLSVYPHDFWQTDAARITKLDREMFHDESWKLIYFGVKRSKVARVTKIAGVGLCTLVNAGFFYLSSWRQD